MTDFLLELRSEEIPARMQDKARADLARLFGEELAKAGLKVETVETYATPRRLALIARGLPLETAAVSEETKGPKTSAPPQALEGFLRKTGLTQDQLEDRDGVYFAVVQKPGRKTADVLAEAIPAIIRAFPWPKSMRWGAASASTESLRWVRPLQGIVALLGDDVVECKVVEISAGSTTTGHRFIGQSKNPVRPEPVEGLPFSAGGVEQDSASTSSARTVFIGNTSTYADDLRAAHVIVDQDERRAIIRSGAEKAASAAGLVLVPDEGLVAENAGLTEWPVPMLGRFDPAFLSVPEEVIQLTARVNQKYFICRDSTGKLANAFVCTANLEPSDGGATMVAGNEKVLAARLSDAKFFWDADLKVKLEDQAAKLSGIVFHEKLGTVADKVERVAKLARWLVESGVVTTTVYPERSRRANSSEVENPNAEESLGSARHSPSTSLGNAELADQAETAARLCKADLVTGMVGEFPELQGIMGGYYARAQGHGDAIADAIRDHYKPVGQGDDVPTAPVTVAVSLADKLDTLVGFFGIGERPTGSKDPFALRRAAIAIIRLIKNNDIRLPLRQAFLVARGFMIQSWLQHFALVSLHDLDGEARPLIYANKIVDEMGEIFAFSEEVRPEYFIDIDGVFVPAYSYQYLSNNNVIEQNFASLDDLTGNLFQYFGDRLEESEKTSGVRVDLIRAVLPKNVLQFSFNELVPIEEFRIDPDKPNFLNVRLRNWQIPDDLVCLLARVKALQAFVGTDAGANLLAGYKRAGNILKSSPSGGGEPAKLVEGHSEGISLSDVQENLAVPLHHPADGSPPRSGEELALESALDTAEPLATSAIAREDFEAAMSALSMLRAPIDAFFEGVMVNDPDPQKRAYRIGLLERFVSAVHRVADFSKIEG